jgi:flagellum-specific peptidoglycan hydrolase FlgJ
VLNRRHIKAPTTHQPSGGRPREHLAYLNRAEMELLRVLTDGVVEPGPKGIPSFAINSPDAKSFGGGTTTSKTTTQSSSLGTKGSATGAGGMFGGGGGGTAAKSSTTQASKSPSAAPKASAAKAPSTSASKGPAASMAAAKASAAKAPAASVSKPKQAAPPQNFAGGGGAKPAAAPPAKPSGGFSQTQFGSSKSNKTDKPAVAAAVARPSQNMQRPSPGMSLTAAQNAARLNAITRGPGVLNSNRAEALARTTAFGESPAGIRAPALAKDLQKAALDNKSLFSMSGATPEQQALLGKIGSSALHVSMQTGLDPRTVLGQAMTESTTGKHASAVSKLARDANNLFGIKGWGKRGENWDGDTVTMPTKEVFKGKTVTVRDPFRAYATPNQSVLDYGDLISRRYSNAADDPTVAGQLRAIRSGGYATHAPSSYVSMGVRNANRLGVGDAAADTQSSGGFQTASAAPAAAVPRPQARPWGPPPIPTARPADLRDPRRMAAGTYTSPYDVAAPRPTPRPPSQNMQRQPAQYSGYGEFNVPPRAPTAGRSEVVPTAPPRPPTVGRSAVVPTMPPPAAPGSVYSGYGAPEGIPTKAIHGRVPAEEERRGSQYAFTRDGKPIYGAPPPASAAAPAAPARGLGGPIGGLVRGGQMLGNMAAGNVQIPGNAIKAGLSDPNIGRYAKARAAGLGTIADAAAGKVIGPAVRQAFADALGGVQNFIKNPPSRSEQAAEQPRGDDGRFTERSETPRAQDGETSTASATRKGKTRTTSDKGNPGRNPPPYIPPPQAPAPEAPGAPVAPPPVDWSYYMNVLTPEQVRRRLLGENWT